MATQKIGLTKLGLKKNTNLISLEWNGQVIEIKEYLPIDKKLDLIGRAVSFAIDDNDFVNPARLQIFETLEIIYNYTNINITDKQKENFLELYDIFVSSGLWQKIKEILITSGEYSIIDNTAKAVVDEVYKFKNSVLGILQSITEDYKDMDFDAEKIKEKISNKENVEFLQEVMQNLG